ncbi:MAG: HAD hydrolase-like protein [Acidobacteriota bacterium]|nr:HAD hydrolase-like protein [Acidobacteriota bacterium]
MQTCDPEAAQTFAREGLSAGWAISQVINRQTFRWMDSDAYLFDIDGTLLVTQDLVHWNALRTAMREVYGADTNIDGIPYHGKTDLGILRAAMARVGVEGERFESGLPVALEVVCREVALNASSINANVCTAVRDILTRLRDAGKLLGVASGNLKSVGWHKVEAAGLRDFFTFGCFSDSAELRADIFREAVKQTRRRLGEQATVCFIGDTPEDVRAARAANAKIIAVSTGTFSYTELSSFNPDLCIASCGDLLARGNEVANDVSA